MAKKLISIFKGPQTKTIGTELIDQTKICDCIKMLYQNNDLLKDIYDAYSATLKFGETKLRETEDTLTKIGVMVSYFDSVLIRWDGQLQDSSVKLKEKEQSLEKLKKEIEVSGRQLAEKRHTAPMVQQWQAKDYERALRLQKIKDYQAERAFLEMRIKTVKEQIDNVMDDLNEVNEKCEQMKDVREEHATTHKADLENLMIEWEQSKEKRLVLQSLAQEVNVKSLLSSLTNQEVDWRAKDKELSELRREHDLLRKNIQDQQDRKDILRLRNDELKRKIKENEKVMKSLKDEKSKKSVKDNISVIENIGVKSNDPSDKDDESIVHHRPTEDTEESTRL